ncbi:AraC family transcriptional regulator [Rahnella sp. SAP-1]|uniref:AraC family transcriptional regulator n=1 Tax=Rouxiella aceris TaxID=2703884 RepID=A0A848MEW4_9GAMM|nr:AraC family transcriptional regulator [Rouxiella aceris]
MENVAVLCAHLAKKVERMSSEKDKFQSPLPQVTLMCYSVYHPRQPVMYNPSITLVFQGRKIGYLGNKVFAYDPKNYLMLTVPLPFECETFGTAEHPVTGISIRIDAVMLQDLLIEMGDEGFSHQADHSSGITSGLLDADILCASERLLDVMEKPLHAKVLGPQIIREILFFILTSENGGALQALVNRHTHFSQIAKALRKIENQYAQALSVEQLASDVNMSVSAFHHNFKAVTSTSPLQYLKNYRLHKARTMMVYDGIKASSAAIRVGYESASQFSREFKRYFGVTPSDEIARMREENILNLAETVFGS